jgi:acetyl-CoA synthetase
MKVKLIDKHFIDRPPNMTDYEATYRSFDWSQVKTEVAFFEDGSFNAAYNALDKHLVGHRKNKVALYWEGEDGQEIKFTFLELALLTNRFGNFLKSIKIKKGSRVFIFLPRVPELFIAFLGTLKIGAVAGTLFSAFGEQALFDRLGNSAASVIVTNEELLPRVQSVEKKLPNLKHIIVLDSENRSLFLEDKPLLVKQVGPHRHWFWQALSKQSDKLRVCHTRPTDMAFMLYTSGTTGKPKGVVHLHQAAIQEHMTAKLALDLTDNDVYWCTADPGWVTGIAYEILGNWSLGASTLVYEGRFDPAKWYDLIQEYKVNVWYTAPTAIRMLAASGLKLVQKYDLSSLRFLASVGEPLNPEAVYWGIKAFKLPFHDIYWQTETGGIVICNYACLPIKPGSMGKPLPGIIADIVNNQGVPIGPNKEGNIALRPGWPSMMAKIWHRPTKYQSYFIKNQKHGRWYITGDRGFKDQDGYFWFIGRSDDVIKTAGERVGPFEVESAINEYSGVIESAVIGKPDPLRGEIIKAFVVLDEATKPTDKLRDDIALYVKKHLAGHAYPREIKFVNQLPKTRSGKIMRRLLKAQELGLPLGDTSTLEEY